MSRKIFDQPRGTMGGKHFENISKTIIEKEHVGGTLIMLDKQFPV
jgi:hypothetical protein